MITMTPADTRAVVDTARHIEKNGPYLLRATAALLAAGLRRLPAERRRIVAAAVSELAMRDAQRPLPTTPANDPKGNAA
jgi:hypothetical protein